MDYLDLSSNEGQETEEELYYSRTKKIVDAIESMEVDPFVLSNISLDIPFILIPEEGSEKLKPYLYPGIFQDDEIEQAELLIKTFGVGLSKRVTIEMVENGVWRAIVDIGISS